jgi:tripartite ATP-independent transporter DctM subunit
LFLGTISLLYKRNAALGPAGEKVSLKERILALNGVVETLVLFMLVIGGMYAGWFTPTEGGAAGSFGALVIALVRRKLTWSGFKLAVLDTLHTSAMVILLVVGAVVLGRFLTFTRLPYVLADWVVTQQIPDLAVLVVIIFVYILGGMFTDALGFLTLSVPVFFPLAAALGFNLIWFAVLVNIITTMGAITPPVGMCVFITKGLRPEVPIQTIMKGAAWFLPAYVIVISLLIAFPQVVTWVGN